MFNPSNMYEIPAYKQGIDLFHDLIIDLRARGETQLAATYMDLNTDLNEMNEINKAMLGDVENFISPSVDVDDLVNKAIKFGQDMAAAEIQLCKSQPDLAINYRIRSLELQMEFVNEVVNQLGDDSF